MLRYVTLHENGGDLGVKPHGEQHRRQVERLGPEFFGFLGDRERVEVDDAVKCVAFVLANGPIAQRAQVVAEVDITSRLDARQDAGHGARVAACPHRPGCESLG